MIEKHCLADADNAIAYLKNKLEKNKDFDDLKKEVDYLRNENNQLIIEKIDLKNKINYIKELWENKELKKYEPPIKFLRKPRNYKNFVCSCCGEEKIGNVFKRILSGKNNYLVCNQCIKFVEKNYYIKNWKIGG